VLEFFILIAQQGHWGNPGCKSFDYHCASIFDGIERRLSSGFLDEELVAFSMDVLHGFLFSVSQDGVLLKMILIMCIFSFVLFLTSSACNSSMLGLCIIQIIRD
jgi:hypothetical protein